MPCSQVRLLARVADIDDISEGFGFLLAYSRPSPPLIDIFDVRQPYQEAYLAARRKSAKAQRPNSGSEPEDHTTRITLWGGVLARANLGDAQFL